MLAPCRQVPAQPQYVLTHGLWHTCRSPSAAGGGAAMGHRRGHRSGRITPGGRPRAGRQVGCSFKVLATWPALWDADICCHLPQRCMQQHIGPTISGGLQAIVCPAVLPICCSTSWGMWCWLIWASRARWIRSLKCGLCKAGHSWQGVQI